MRTYAESTQSNESEYEDEFIGYRECSSQVSNNSDTQCLDLKQQECYYADEDDGHGRDRIIAFNKLSCIESEVRNSDLVTTLDNDADPKTLKVLRDKHIKRMRELLRLSSFPLFHPTDLSFFNISPREVENAAVADTKKVQRQTVHVHHADHHKPHVCWWDHHEIVNQPHLKSIPISRCWNKITNVVSYVFLGCFCSWECANAFQQLHLKNTYHRLLLYARSDIDEISMDQPLRCHPHPFILERYGGKVTLSEFRGWWTRGPNSDIIDPTYKHVVDMRWKITTDTVILNNPLSDIVEDSSSTSSLSSSPSLPIGPTLLWTEDIKEAEKLVLQQKSLFETIGSAGRHHHDNNSHVKHVIRKKRPPPAEIRIDSSSAKHALLHQERIDDIIRMDASLRKRQQKQDVHVHQTQTSQGPADFMAAGKMSASQTLSRISKAPKYIRKALQPKEKKRHEIHSLMYSAVDASSPSSSPPPLTSDYATQKYLKERCKIEDETHRKLSNSLNRMTEGTTGYLSSLAPGVHTSTMANKTLATMDRKPRKDGFCEDYETLANDIKQRKKTLLLDR